MNEEKKAAPKEKKQIPHLVALRDFHICRPGVYDRHIKAGDDLAKVPSIYHENLVTEGVLAKGL